MTKCLTTEASERTKAHSQKTCFIAFDQSLHLKAGDYVETGQYSELRSLVERLGGFHLLVTFNVRISAITTASGLKE